MNGFLDSTPYSQLWQPNTLSNPATYPAPTTVNRRGRNKPAAMVPVQVPEQVFKVNTGGDWSGATNGYNPAGPLENRLFRQKNYNVSGMVGGGAVAGGAGSGGGSDPIGQFQQKMDQANQANEARYRDILGGYQARYQRAMDMLNGLGQQEAKDVNELHDQRAAAQRQSLIGRGLGNSTVLDTMLAGSDRERNADLGRLNDRVRQQALNTDAGLTGDTLQFMERRTDQQPDMGLLASLMQSLGQGGGYGGGLAGVPIDAGFGGGGFAGPMGFMGYMPPSGGSASNNARLARAAGYRRERNANKTDWPGQGGPVSSDYARSWLPTGYMTPAEEAAADAERVRNAIAESGAGNQLVNPYAWFGDFAGG